MASKQKCSDNFSKLSVKGTTKLCLKHIFWQIPATHKSDFGFPIFHYHPDTYIRNPDKKYPENRTKLIFSAIFEFLASRGKVEKVFLGLNVDWFAMKMIKWTVIVIWIQKPQQFHQEWISFKQNYWSFLILYGKK